jgi:hypothetical protein
MTYATRVLLWRDFFDDEVVLIATGAGVDMIQPDVTPQSVCVLGCLHLDSLLDLFGFEAYTRVAQATRDQSLLPVEISLRFFHEDGR